MFLSKKWQNDEILSKKWQNDEILSKKTREDVNHHGFATRQEPTTTPQRRHPDSTTTRARLPTGRPECAPCRVPPSRSATARGCWPPCPSCSGGWRSCAAPRRPRACSWRTSRSRSACEDQGLAQKKTPKSSTWTPLQSTRRPSNGGSRRGARRPPNEKKSTRTTS